MLRLHRAAPAALVLLINGVSAAPMRDTAALTTDAPSSTSSTQLLAHLLINAKHEEDVAEKAQATHMHRSHVAAADVHKKQTPWENALIVEGISAIIVVTSMIIVSAMAAFAEKKQEFAIKCAVEFFGTFFLNVVATTSSDNTLWDGFAPFTVGSTVALIVLVGAPISGAHYNPNLTLGFTLCRDTACPSIIAYTLSILSGAIMGNWYAYMLQGYTGGLPITLDSSLQNWVEAMACEFVGSFATTLNVMYIAHIANPPLGPSGPIYVALGFFTMILAFRAHGGAVFNPGLAFGIWLVAVR